MRHFNFTDVRGILTTIVKEKGANHVGTIGGDAGNGCEYIDGTTRTTTGRLVPSCVVGYFFDYIGLLGLMLASTYSQEGACGTDSPIWSKCEQVGVTFSDEARTLLHEFQKFQDDGLFWGVAFQRAVDAVREAALNVVRDDNPDLFSDAANHEVNVLAELANSDL